MPKLVQTTRQMGEQERLLNYLHAFGGLTVMQVLHIRGQLDAEVLKKGLKRVQRRHAMARAHVRYGGLVFRKYPPFVYRQPWFELTGTHEIPLRVVTKDWQEVLAAELRRPMPRGRAPRLRLTLVEDRANELTQILFAADTAPIYAQS